jgi:DNA invertase Pin-like site-specific DNA recombinase
MASERTAHDDAGTSLEISMIIGYCRVSRVEPAAVLQAQQRALAATGAQKFFVEKNKVNGNISELEMAINFAQKGDVIAVTRPYRVARSTRGVLALIDRLGKKGVGFRILDTPIDTSTTTGRMILGSAPVWSLGMSPLRSALWDLSLGWMGL